MRILCRIKKTRVQTLAAEIHRRIVGTKDDPWHNAYFSFISHRVVGWSLAGGQASKDLGTVLIDARVEFERLRSEGRLQLRRDPEGVKLVKKRLPRQVAC